MLDSTVELLVGLCLIALPLMISLCIVGSVVAALRALSRDPQVTARHIIYSILE